MKKEEKKKKFRLLRIAGKIVMTLFVLLLLLLLFVRSPWGQDLIVQKLVNSVSEKTGTEISVEKVFISFDGNVNVENLYLEDLSGDTLVYSKTLEIDIPLWPIIIGKGIAINSVDWKGLTANIVRKDSLDGFNYQFLIDAYAAPDTTATAPEDTTTTKFDLGEIHLQDFDLKYEDAVSGTHAEAKFQTFDLEMELLDLKEMRFEINKIALSHAMVVYKQEKPSPETQDSTSTEMPFVSIGELTLTDVKARYQSKPDELAAKIDLGKFILELPEANLSENTVVVDRLLLENSGFLVHTKTEEKVAPEELTAAESSSSFEWPDWNVQINDVSLSENQISYLVNNEKPSPGTFNPDAISLKNFHLQLNDFSLLDETLNLNLKNFGFIEASGIHLKELAFETTLGNNHLSVENFLFSLNDNFIKGKFSATYSSIDDLLENPENTQINLNLPHWEIALSDIFLFQPNLKNNEYLLALSKEKLTGNFTANGTLSAIKIPAFNVNWGEQTSITASGAIKNATEPENIQFDFPQFDLVSTRADLIKFVNEDSLGISIPKNIQFTSSFRGSPEDITAEATLLVPEGAIELAGSFKNKNELAFDLNLEVKAFDLGQLLQNDQLGKMTLTLKTKGAGSNLNTLDATIDTKIIDFSYNNYAFENLNIDGEIENGSGNIFMDYKDNNLDMEMKTLVTLDSIAPTFDLHLDLKGAALQPLGLSSRDIRAKTILEAVYKGNPDGFDIEATAKNGVVTYDNNSYLMGDIAMRAHINPDTTAVDIANKILDLQLRSNAEPTELLAALQNHLRSYITKKVETPDTLSNPVKLQVNATVNPMPILTKVLLPELQRLETVKIAVDFDQSTKKLDAAVNLPFINYGGNQIDSLQLSIVSNKTDYKGDLSFKAINTGPISIGKTSLSATLADKRLYMDFKSSAKDSLLMNVHSYFSTKKDTLLYHIDPQDLLLNGKSWDISANNRLVLAKKYVGAKDFRLHRNNQEITINDNPTTNKDQLSLGFENFPLTALLGFLNAENHLASGKLDGGFVIKSPFGNTGIIADLNIHELVAMDTPLGNLSLKASSVGSNTYDFDLELSEGDILLDLTGNYVADSTAAKLDMQLDLEKLKLDAIKNFTDGAISDTKGFISGNFQINGTSDQPQYAGAFKFNDAQFNVSMLNALFKIADETIKIDNEGLYFDHFEITDENSSGFVLDGNISTKNYLNPAFDLNFEAKNFTALNSTSEDNELYYGEVVFDLNGKLSGDMSLPIVDLELDMAPETNLTYVIPPSEIAVVSRDGIVTFVNKKNPDNILTRSSQKKTTTLSGVIFNSIINISEGSIFNVIIDKKTGDNLQIAGEGTLNFNISANGSIHLAGRYDINDGHYEVNLYNLIKKRFDIEDGSSISWFGEPLEASLDITASHKVETSVAPLMAAQTSGAVESKFQQKLTFLVYLYADGWLMQPKISFGLGMPEDERGSLGGQVYSTVQQLNQQKSELNKQVFSLLVLNRFYPQGNNYGAQGGALTLARDNLNQLLSDQLNQFSDRLMGDSGVNLNFGLDSYTDYQGKSPQERTALEISAEKRFFDDRLIVEVGSVVDLQGGSDPGESGKQPLVENINIQYLLTEDGRFRLKGFRKNTFENVIDGQVIINGIALIFQKQFNTFEHLWKSELKKMEKEKEEEKSETKEQQEAHLKDEELTQ